jgi:CyaY protein
MRGKRPAVPDSVLGRGALIVVSKVRSVAHPIDEAEFDDLADRTLRALELALNDIEGLEADLESGILNIEFSDEERFVVNSHRAARQIWMAARANAWHFDVDPRTAVWTATKTGEDLWACLQREIGQKLGRSIALARR